MRAAVLRATGDTDLEVIDTMETVPVTAGKVRVDIQASGICHSDLSGMNGTLMQPAPAVLGHEGAGVVTEVGEGVDTLRVGDHVIIAWTPPCGQCPHCTTHGQPHLCRVGIMENAVVPNFLDGDTPIFGFVGTGTFTDETVVPQNAVVHIPDDIPFDVAALVGCGVTTGVGAAINRAKIVPGSNVVVFGAGGVGVAAIQGAKIAGAAEIVAVDLSKEKAEATKAFGATHAATPDELDGLKAELTEGVGFDYAFEAIGLSQTMRATYDAARPGGTVIIIGAGKMDDFVQFNGFELFMDEKTLMGSYFGSDATDKNFMKMLKLWKAGRLDLEGMVDRRLQIADINDAIHAMERGETVRQIIDLS